MLRVFNNTARYVDQGEPTCTLPRLFAVLDLTCAGLCGVFLSLAGGGKRKGAFAVYLEPWHADIMSFLVRPLSSSEFARVGLMLMPMPVLRCAGPSQEHWCGGDPRSRPVLRSVGARSLHEARGGGRQLVPLLPQRGPRAPRLPQREVQRALHSVSTASCLWLLLCPCLIVRLVRCSYEKEGRARKTVRARDIWQAVLDSQASSSLPVSVVWSAVFVVGQSETFSRVALQVLRYLTRSGLGANLLQDGVFNNERLPCVWTRQPHNTKTI